LPMLNVRKSASPMVEGSTGKDTDYGRLAVLLPVIIESPPFFLVSKCALVNDLIR